MARSCYDCCSGKVISITNSECVFVATDVQHAPIFSSVVCPAAQYISTLTLKRHDFRKKKNAIEHEMHVLIISNIFYGPFVVQCVSSAKRMVHHIYNNVLVLCFRQSSFDSQI